jgi:hypothetical protein
MEKSFTIRVPRRWVRIAMIVGVSALILAPITAAATHSFSDVPNSHTFHGDIAWLANAGVTKGCNPPANTNYCPDDNVTRGQMSAFMRRLAENRVVDAARVQGYSPDELAPRVAFNSDEEGDGTGAQPHKLSTEITAPSRGTLVMSGNMETYHGGFGTTTTCWLEVDDQKVHGSETHSTPGGDDDDGCATSGAMVVDSGTYTVDLAASGPLWYWDESVWVMWVPFNGQGNTP